MSGRAAHPSAPGLQPPAACLQPPASYHCAEGGMGNGVREGAPGAVTPGRGALAGMRFRRHNSKALSGLALVPTSRLRRCRRRRRNAAPAMREPKLAGPRGFATMAALPRKSICGRRLERRFPTAPQSRGPRQPKIAVSNRSPRFSGRSPTFGEPQSRRNDVNLGGQFLGHLFRGRP